MKSALSRESPETAMIFNQLAQGAADREALHLTKEDLASTQAALSDTRRNSGSGLGTALLVYSLMR